MTRVCVVVTARPSWAKLQTVCEALRARQDVDLQIVACASALLERYGKVIDVIKGQGFEVAEEVWSVYEGENTRTSVHGTAALSTHLVSVFQRLGPGYVLVCADRHEVLGAAIAATYTNIPLSHLQGGERTGSIDDRVRDSVTQLATYHFPCTDLSAFRINCLTGAYDRIHQVGCSSLDLAKRAQGDPPVTADELGGAGAPINLEQPFGIVLQHPVTSEADQAHAQMEETLSALDERRQWIVMWPGQDAGADGISKAIREQQDWSNRLHTVRNLPPQRFLRLLTQASVLVGNSSAGIREGSYLGVPTVNIGSRQFGRERAGNVVDVSHERQAIHEAITRQVAHGPYPSSHLYGTGDAGERIAEVLSDAKIYQT